MTAIVTNKFRVTNAENFKEDVTNSNVYVFIGKSDSWSDQLATTSDPEAPIPADDDYELRLAYKNMIGGIRISSSDITHVVPRYNWVSGNSYVAWDDRDEQIFTKQFYVITDERKVFKCLKAGSGGSINKPTQTSVTPVEEGDGYTWKYMYTLAIVDAEKFLTNFYIPVKTVLALGGSEADDTQYTNQEASKSLKGKIYNIKVTNGGSGYTTNPTVTITGDGSGATATAVRTGTVVTSINVTAEGVNYNVANVTITGGGGTNATARAIISPGQGHGTDPVEELGSSYTAINVRLDGDVGGDFIVNNNFRQIGILKDPIDAGGTDQLTASTFSALKTLTVPGGGPTSFIPGEYITGSISGAVAYVDDWDDALNEVKYHQNNKTGFKVFQVGDVLTGSLGSGGTVSALGNSEYTPQTGQIIFIENRAPINRSASQIEDVKIIIEF